MGEAKTGRKSAISPAVEETSWKKPSDQLFRRKVIIIFPPEDNGLISVYAADLPGVASQGCSEEEALKNIVDAFEAAFAAYKEIGEEIPWKKTPLEKLESGAELRWVFVHG